MTPQTPLTETLILGIDGGGTKTIAWLARTGSPDEILGRGFAGPSNQRAIGPHAAMNNLDDAVQSAFDHAGMNRQTVEAACLGLAGADRDSDRSVIETWARDARLARRVRVVNDAVPLLHAGNSDGCGVALIAGTGSLAWGQNSQGQTARSGGWGYLIGDEGSAFAIGRAVLQAATRQADGLGPETCLLGDVCRSLEVASTVEIVTAVYSHEIPRAVIAGLAPLAFDAAERLDVVSCRIVTGAASDLAAMVMAVTERLHLQDHLSFSVTGAVLLQHQKFRDMIIDMIASQGVRVASTTVVADPVLGAVRMAESMAAS